MGFMEYGTLEGIKVKFSDVSIAVVTNHLSKHFTHDPLLHLPLHRQMYVPALLANWKVWPAIQLANFRFVPLRFRVPFTSACGIFWTLYLSLLAATTSKAEEQRGVTIDKAN